MVKQNADFMVYKNKGVVAKVGKSEIKIPKVNYSGKGIKWFDDTKLLKKNK